MNPRVFSHHSSTACAVLVENKMQTIHDQLVLCFHRKQPDPDKALTHFMYIKRSSETGEYAIKYKNRNNESTLYKTTQFLVPALSMLALLMAEYGLGAEWEVLPTK